MKAIWRVVVFTRYLWKWYVAAGLGVLVTALLSLATPLLSKEVVDQVVEQVQTGAADTERIIWLLAAMLTVQIVSIVVSSVGGWTGDMIEVKLRMYLSSVFYQKLLSLDVSFFDNNDSGRTINKFYRGIAQITGFIQGMLNNFLPMVMTAVVTIGLLAMYSWTLAILLTVMFPIYIFISQKSTQDWKQHEDVKNELSDTALSRAYESIAGIRTVKSFATETLELLSFKRHNDDIERTTARQSRGWHAYDFARQFVLNGVLFASFAYTIYHTFHGRYTIGEMTLLIQLVQQARIPLFAMSYILGQVQRVEAGSKDFFAIMETEVVIADPESVQPLEMATQKGQAVVSFDGVGFGYETDKRVLSEVSFDLLKGQKLALVGESGQGKSTIVNLLLRFYDPQLGVIRVGGQNIAEVNQQSLHRQIAVVFQEAWLFSGTILDNIQYGKPEAPFDEVVAAAKAANADEFIQNLPQGYHSLVGERGVKLSGGQKQRIAIARAILKNAPIIVLDEATSALDSKSELLVQEGLDRLMHGRTSIVIAHRLSTVAEADLIAVVDKGQLAEFGSPGNLLKKKTGLYRQLVDLQQSLTGKSSAARKKALRQFDLVG